MSTFVGVQERGTIALPARIRQAYHLNQPGAQVEVIEEADRIVLIPKLPVNAAQAWFWTDGWQAGERRAAEEAAAGLGQTYDSAEAFLNGLDNLDGVGG
ncbi:MAG: AbrB/MazE/SpoVT family DNA-binding domain-containing protein [Propionibacteriaceae bacterium]|jgi:bifunctional DNA-binding transcriptional regulator/antitoxin component of YhaV-PrlF toxin-antitoxin module|nr:AbrB/MazE/SpoVT family DNA-binding domain-containing protein [Propionibacteriaceae bacterium]